MTIPDIVLYWLAFGTSLLATFNAGGKLNWVGATLALLILSLLF